MDVRKRSLFFLYQPLDSLAGGFFRNCAMGLLYGGAFVTGYAWYEPLTLPAVAGLTLVGWSVSFALWSSYRLWSHTIAVMMTSSGTMFHRVTKIPFWFIAGGIGYTVGLLTVKKLGLFPVQDIPVKAIFLFGGRFCAVVQIVFEMVELLSIREKKPS